MNSKRKITFVVSLAMALSSMSFCWANNNEFNRDYTRATILEQSKNLNALANLIEEIQNKWSKKDKQMYGALMVNALHSWESAYRRADKKAPMNLIRQYATQVLSTYDPNKPDNISIESEFDLVSILYEQYEYSEGKLADQEWIKNRRKGTERWFHAWQRLENAIDEDWDPNDIPEANVSPPKGIGIPGIPGMSPELIKDPVLRAEYEKAIEKNREKVKIRNEQIKLRNTKKMYYRIVEKYLVQTYSIPPFANDELRQYLEKFKIDKETQTRITEAVTKNIDKQNSNE